MDNVDVHRLHFAFTIIYHYIFPQLTMGLPLLILVLKTLALLGDTAALTLHGALWLHARTDEAVQRRSGSVAGMVWPIVLTLSILVAIASFIVQPNIIHGLETRPWGVICPMLAIVSIISVPLLLKKSRSRMAFRAFAVYLASMVASTAVGVYPYALPARDPALGITVANAAAPAEGLRAALYWWVPGMLLVCG